jgi:hypothetical protein
MINRTPSLFKGRQLFLYFLQILVLSTILSTSSHAQELSLKLVGFFNTSTTTALVDRQSEFSSFQSSIAVAGGEYAHRVSPKWSIFTAVSSSRTFVDGNAGPLKWPAEFVSGEYVDDDTWPNNRYVREEGTSVVLSLGGRRYFNVGKKSLLPFVSLQGDIFFNHSMWLYSEYFNRRFDRTDFQPQFARVSEEIDKQKNISAALVALVGIELRLGTLIKLRGGWTVRADLLDYARNVDYLKTFARGITLQAGIDLPTAKRAFFPKKDKVVEE